MLSKNERGVEMRKLKIGDKVTVEGSELQKFHGIGTITDLSKISATVRWITGTSGIYAINDVRKQETLAD